MIVLSMNSNLLDNFDVVIQKSRENLFITEESQELKSNALRCILSLAGENDLSEKALDSKFLSLLDNFKGLEQKKLIALCILRLLPESSMKWLADTPWRPKVASLLDSLFSDDLYAERKVSESLQAHEKLEKLAEIVREHEQSFLGGIQMLTSLAQINTHRQKLMIALNSKTGRILLAPFLPDNTQAELGELYKCMNTYLSQHDELGIVDAQEKCTQVLAQFNQALSTKGTLYSRWLLDGVGEKLLTLISEDFASSKAIQPATISIKAQEKKYPLHIAGRLINISFTLENRGLGYAYDTRLLIVANGTIELSNEEIDFGRLEPMSSHVVRVPAEVLFSSSQIEMTVQANWCIFDKTSYTAEISFIVNAQRNDVDWDHLEQYEPYSLEPVSNEDELAGRRDVLNRLIATAKAPGVGSSVIYGQKRVGKTSIATALKSHLEGLGYMVVDIEAGSYVQAEAGRTVASLGIKLCDKIRRLEPRLRHLSVPDFNDALSPLDEFLDDVAEVIPNINIVIILDEFDQLPIDLYLRNPLGNSFFVTLRSLSSRKGVGFVLVGGEKMNYVMDYQGMQLNKWKVFPVDYFTREENWNDYQDLVQRPVEGQLEYAEDALLALHDVTAGNPYFTKLVCQYVFQKALENRDCHVTKVEVDAAIESTTSAKETDVNTFAHFWEDGIVETGTEATDKSIRRRKILIALSDALVEKSPAPELLILQQSIIKHLTYRENELKELATRKVLLPGEKENTFEFKVRLFHDWLRRRGMYNVIATFPELDKALQVRQEEEKLKIQANELVALTKKWGAYRGQSVTEDKVRAWVEQFGDIREQRAMFTLLQGLCYYSQSFVREKMHEVDSIVKSGLTRQLASKESRKSKQSDILISYLDGVAKSGADLARLYADEASIYVDNVVERSKLASRLSQHKEIKALVFVDDFVGTGNAVSDYLRELDAEVSEIVQSRRIKVVFVAVVACLEGWSKIERTVDEIQMHVNIHHCELLDNRHKCFSEESIIIKDYDQRQRALQAASNHGKYLEPNCPLGYGGLEMAVVFERGCPNNSLAVLWSESVKHKWVPLFKRL